MDKSDFAGMKILIMGLGLNGGNVEAALYLAKCGAELTVTDLRDEKTLAPSIERLAGFPVRYVLGKHETKDFIEADMVIKNPDVKPDSPFLKAARRIETDISLFLYANPARLFAVTGSKGKSSTASALFHVLNEYKKSRPSKEPVFSGKVRLGGNITRSPLSFLDELEEGDDAVLELSSWQLGDLRGRDLLKPRTAIITSIMRDHQDWYGSMEAYVADKRFIYRNQNEEEATVACDDEWGRSFLRESRGRPLVYSSEPLAESIRGGWILGHDGPGFANLHGKIEEVVPMRLLVPGAHQKQNLLAASLALLDIGMPSDYIRESLGRFPGLEHRLEFFHEKSGIRFYNDSTASIPEAAAAAIRAFGKPPVLVTGGTDKELDFTPLALAADEAKAVILLAGTGTAKLKALLDKNGTRYKGPFDSLEAAVYSSLEAAGPGDSVVLSPGSASFGMFANEFDRGRKWKEEVKKLAH